MGAILQGRKYDNKTGKQDKKWRTKFKK
jgi:hypothetical protein